MSDNGNTDHANSGENLSTETEDIKDLNNNDNREITSFYMNNNNCQSDKLGGVKLKCGTSVLKRKVPRKVKSLEKLLHKKVRFKDLGIKMKSNRDPLPMKLRALPHSFWQQPNQPGNMSPAPLPPMAAASSMPPHSTEDLQEARSNNNDTNVTASINSCANDNESIVSDANTELLFSLFNSIDREKRSQRRGRPKKKTNVKSLISARDEDPCLVPSGIFSCISPTKPQSDSPKCLNYSQILNDLVFQL